MPRLAEEGIVGADAIFACLGPALEIFSRYSRVEKANGEQVTLREYLEYVWAAVAREALGMIFAGADASGLEEDARLTAMWLWTLSTGDSTTGLAAPTNGEEDEEGEGNGGPARATGGYVLEYDAARKIAQGLGAHLDRLGNVVQVKGDKARLLSLAERRRYLLGKAQDEAPRPRRPEAEQLTLFGEAARPHGAADPQSEQGAVALGQTVLDRVHQAMLLFASGRGEALKRFLVEEGVGGDARFWRLAQALSALYPKHSDEKRWVDGVLARKKGLGL